MIFSTSKIITEWLRNKSGIEPEICQVNSGCGMVSDVQYLNFIDQNETEEVKN